MTERDPVSYMECDVVGTVGKGTKICIEPYRENLTPEALRYGSHSFFPANTPYLP